VGAGGVKGGGGPRGGEGDGQNNSVDYVKKDFKTLSLASTLKIRFRNMGLI